MERKLANHPSPEEIRYASTVPWQWVSVWQRAGLCNTEPGDWFAESVKLQKRCAAICQRCPVRRQCLGYALETGERSGVWGGLTERELRKAAALTPQGARRLRGGAKTLCPWCKCDNLGMCPETEERVACHGCGFSWPGLVRDEEEPEAEAS